MLLHRGLHTNGYSGCKLVFDIGGFKVDSYFQGTKNHRRSIIDPTYQLHARVTCCRGWTSKVWRITGGGLLENVPILPKIAVLTLKSAWPQQALFSLLCE